MKEIKMYKDEISGLVFSTKKEAVASEKRKGGILKLFSFWKYPKKDGTCSFENGDWCYQRTKEEYSKLIKTLIKAVKLYEPWICKQYKKDGGLQEKHIGSGYMIGRYLCDGNSELYKYYGLISNICRTCFREWGQPYYANNCSHFAKAKKVTK